MMKLTAAQRVALVVVVQHGVMTVGPNLRASAARALVACGLACGVYETRHGHRMGNGKDPGEWRVLVAVRATAAGRAQVAA